MDQDTSISLFVPDEILCNTILRVTVGSEGYGVSESRSSDRDEKGVCIEPFEKAVGLHGFEQFEYRSASARTGKKDEPSRPGDLDLTIYSLKKFLRLALKGNPTIIEMLFLQSHVGTSNPLGAELQGLAPLIVSRHCGGPYLGYMKEQRRKLVEKKPQEGTERWELIQKFGYDTKYAGHLLRLGLQGIELLQYGRLTFPLAPFEAAYIKGVRNGEYHLDEVLASASALEHALRDLLYMSPLQRSPDVKAIDTWMTNTYWRYWESQKKLDTNPTLA